MENPTALLSQRLQQVMEIDTSQVAIWSDGRSWTWADIGAVQVGIDEALHQIGAPARGARVALMMKTSFAGVACQTALLARGHTIFSLSPMMGDERLERDIASSGAWLVLADDGEWSRSAVRRGCELSGAAGYAVGQDATVSKVLDFAPVDPRAEASPLVANVMLTSGTTSEPKRIPIEYSALDNMLSAVRHYAASTRAAQDEVRLRSHPAIIASPLVHSSGFGGVVRSLAEARPLVLLERFKVEPWVEVVERFQPRTVALPPPALTMILEAGVDPRSLSSLRAIVVGSAALPSDLEAAFEDAYGIPLLATYGATEFPGGLAGWTLADKLSRSPDKASSVGRAHPGVELRVNSAESGLEVPPGERGLLDVRTPATDRSVRDGWVQTNDIASIDADGFLYIHGRADDAIIRGGFKVVPQEVESVLRTHPAVADVGVVGRPDSRLGAVPVAVVELAGVATSQELLDYARGQLAGYQVPAELHMIDSLPRTPSMKVSKPQLRDWLKAQEDSNATHP